LNSDDPNRSMYLDTVVKLAHALDVSTSEMIGDASERADPSLALMRMLRVIEGMYGLVQDERVDMNPGEFARPVLQLYAMHSGDTGDFTLTPEMRNVILLGRRRK
jgi:hypothetical protein